MPEYPIVLALITVAGVVVSALVTWSIAQRRIAIKHVTAERSEWRRNVRTLAAQVHKSILRNETGRLPSLRTKFGALLNPLDPEDEELLKLITEDSSNESREKKGKEFNTRISLLLKHDWERAKLEAGWFLPRWILEAKRHTLDCTKEKGCICRGKIHLPRCDTYRVKLLPVLVLGLVLIVAFGVAVCALCHCYGTSTTKATSTFVFLDANMGNRVNLDSPFCANDG